MYILYVIHVQYIYPILTPEWQVSFPWRTWYNKTLDGPDHKLSAACSVQITSCQVHALSDHKLSGTCFVRSRSVGYMLCPDHKLSAACSVQITSCRLHALSRSWAVGCMLCQITSCQMHALSWSQAVGCMLWPDHKLSDVCSDQITSCQMHALSDL